MLYFYKGVIATPPLQMVDDILGIQNCPRKSKRMNGTIEGGTSLKWNSDKY